MTSKVSKKEKKPRSAGSPWEKGNPKPDGQHKHLSPPAKAAAKRAAKKAGRKYPNLIDNMRAAAGAKK